MKKLLSLTLAAAIGLSGMNIQAAKESPKDTADLIGKREYIIPAILVGAGVLEVVFGTFCLYAGFVELPRMQDDLKKKVVLIWLEDKKDRFSSLSREEADKYFATKFPFHADARYFSNLSRRTTQTIGIGLFGHGLTEITQGLVRLKLIRLKNVKRTQAMLKKSEKEQVQA